ncbi:nucleoside hydrolase [Paenibacillus agricola]|uniref:nucleoside hydrolase n=1 Tax=Paenibacillus agricola TaxID=2716264 RepID=UPI001FB82C01|nr:nucleoside hydrolase [Paenibacillus agricola]
MESELPIILVGLDVTRKTLLTRDDMLRWRGKGTELSTLFANFTEFYLNVYQVYHPYLDGCALHDPLAVAVALDPTLVLTLPMYVKVDLDKDADGRTVEDLNRTSPSGPNTLVCVQVDAKRFMDTFFRLLEMILGEQNKRGDNLG